MADMKKGFDLADVLKNVSNPDTSRREQIVYIDIDLIDADPLNFYEMSDIDALAENIELIGLQQPLRVRNNPETAGRVVIVSGHRRRAAIQKLVDDGREDLRQVPCIREQQASSPALQELRLLYANADTRRMTPADISKQAERVEAVLYQLKEEGFDFPGRMRDHVAEICKVSKTKLARLKVIRDNLLTEWIPYFEDGSLNETAAYALAQLSEDYQKVIFTFRYSNSEHPAKWFGEYIIKDYARCMAEIDSISCKKDGGEQCSNGAGKYQKMLSRSCSWQRDRCSKCCSKCEDLASCKYACPKLAGKIKKLKEQRKEDRRNEKQLQEERERPVIEQIKDLWNRFGQARNAAVVSVGAFKKHLGHYHFGDEEQKYVEKECLEAKFTTQTELPFGYDVRLAAVNVLVKTAQLFGCSTDYLLGLSDQMKGGPSGTPVPTDPSVTERSQGMVWYSREVEPPVGVKIVVVTDEGWTEDNRYAGGGCLDDECVTRWDRVKAWTYMPGEDLIRHGFAVPPSPEGKALGGCWLPGTMEPEEVLDAVADFVHGELKLRKIAHWNGRIWQFPGGASIDAQCVRWYPLPEDDKKESGDS